MDLRKILENSLIDTIKKLGIVGTISFVGANLVFFVLTKVNFQIEVVKALILLFVGTLLLLFSGLIYWQERKEESSKVKEALGVLREVYNRMAEQLSVADRKKTVSITMTINNLPDKIADVIKKSLK